MIEFECYKCGEALSVPSSLTGREQVCPACGAQTRVPVAKAETPNAAPGNAEPKSDRRETIWISCSRCSVAMGVARHHAGKEVLCPKCGHKVRVPRVWRTSGTDEQLNTALAYAIGAKVDVDDTKVLGGEPAQPDDDAPVHPAEPDPTDAPQAPEVSEQILLEPVPTDESPEPAEPAREPVADVRQQRDAAKAYASLAARAIVASNAECDREANGIELISTACPKCSSAIEVPMCFAGTKIRCPGCNRKIRVPKARLAAGGDTLATHVHVESPGAEPPAAATAGDEQTDAVTLVPRSSNAGAAEPEPRFAGWAADNADQLIAAMGSSADTAGASDGAVATESEAPVEQAEPTVDDEHAGAVTLVPKKKAAEESPPEADAPGVFESTWRRQIAEARALRQPYRAETGADPYPSWSVDQDDPYLCWEACRYDREPPCEDCQDRDGTIRRASEWARLGVPGACKTACGDACRCSLTLDPELGADDFLTGTIQLALRPAGAVCREPDVRWDRQIIRVTPESMIPTILDRWPDLRRAGSVVWMWLVEELQAMCGDVPDAHLIHALSVSLEALETHSLQALARQWSTVNCGDGATGLAAASGALHHRLVAEFLARAYLERAEELMQEIVDQAADMARQAHLPPADYWTNAKARILAAADQFIPTLAGLAKTIETFTSLCTRHETNQETPGTP